MNNSFFEKIRQTAVKYAAAKASKAKLDSYRKIIKSELMIEAQENGFKTIVSQENYAQTHFEYKKSINDLSDAIHQESLLYWELKSFEMEMEYWRTSEATKRAEMKLI